MFDLRKLYRKYILLVLLVGILALTTSNKAIAQSQAGWLGEYYNNTMLSGAPVLVRVDKSIDFD